MVLVTGASGFVGSAVCHALLARGNKIIGAVRQDAREGQINVGNLSASTDWHPALAGCKVVIHLAARVHILSDKVKNPLHAYREVNVDATLNLAKQAVQSGVKRFVFVSSVKVNGEETKDKPFIASDKPAPLDPYGQSKLEAEIALMELSRTTGLEVVIIRPPLVHGPGVRGNFLRLMQLVRMGAPLPLGAIHNRRSMVALDNLVDLLITCTYHPDAAGGIFMVSDGQDVSTSELLRMLGCAMGKHPLLLPVPVRIIAGVAALAGKAAVANRLLGSLQVDISHTKSILGWQPIISMQESINKTVAHFLIQR